jgi:hypothetical protein
MATSTVNDSNRSPRTTLGDRSILGEVLALVSGGVFAVPHGGW